MNIFKKGFFVLFYVKNNEPQIAQIFTDFLGKKRDTNDTNFHKF